MQLPPIKTSLLRAEAISCAARASGSDTPPTTKTMICRHGSENDFETPLRDEACAGTSVKSEPSSVPLAAASITASWELLAGEPPLTELQNLMQESCHCP